MVAFMPTCNRDCETASHTPGSDGISTIGVGMVSVTGASVADGMGAAVCVGMFVSGSVGDGVPVSGGEVEEGAAAVGVGRSGVDVAGTGVRD